MDLSSIPPSPMKGIVNIVVEIPAGSRNKYEYCSDAGIMALDRVLHSSVRYPFDYGFIPQTRNKRHWRKTHKKTISFFWQRLRS